MGEMRMAITSKPLTGGHVITYGPRWSIWSPGCTSICLLRAETHNLYGITLSNLHKVHVWEYTEYKSCVFKISLEWFVYS